MLKLASATLLSPTLQGRFKEQQHWMEKLVAGMSSEENSTQITLKRNSIRCNNSFPKAFNARLVQRATASDAEVGMPVAEQHPIQNLLKE